MTRYARVTRYGLLAAALAMATVLLIFALGTYRELAEMQQVYLRDRAASLAGLLETLPAEQLAGPLVATLSREEPALVDLQVFRPDQPGEPSPELEPIWSGRELFRTEEITREGQRLFRALIPFHSEQRLNIARIELALTASDFLLSQARRNLLVASFSGMALVCLALWAVWSASRAAELQRRELQMQSLAQLGQMSAVLAHEIRNPLGTIKGFAQLACEKGDEKIVALLSPVLGEIQRLEKLVRDLLFYSKPAQPALAWVDWTAFTGELRQYAEEAIGGRRVVFLCDDWEGQVETDADLLKEILLNLIRNSVEALAQAPEGEVRLSAQDGPRAGFTIAVEDNGPGVPDSAAARLFEPFFTTRAAGTGLGLSVARKLAQSLGGDLGLSGVAPHGTRAELVFASAKVKHGKNIDHR